MAGGETGIVNFPVKENAAGMSTRQIVWEKRKRVKEATVATAMPTSSFNLLLDSFNLFSWTPYFAFHLDWILRFVVFR